MQKAETTRDDGNDDDDDSSNDDDRGNKCGLFVGVGHSIFVICGRHIDRLINNIFFASTCADIVHIHASDWVLFFLNISSV